jgi:hypothetical protein
MPIGAIVVFARPPIATQGHVGFYAGAQTAQSISVLGGNQGNAVRIAPYAKARLLGGRWPRLDRRNPR